MMDTCLVTGGAGFIGSHLVEALLVDNYRVIVLDNFSTGNRENIASYGPQVEVIEGDLRDYGVVCDVLKGVDFVFHQAALPSVPRSINDPITTNEVNVVGTLNLLNASINASVRRLVFASSSSVYGANKSLPKREDMLPEPISPYAVSKLAGEKYCLAFSHVYGLDTVCLRYFNVFGPRQDPTSAYAAFIPIFLDGLLRGKKLTVNGDGSISRDFTHVKNVVTANLRAIQSADVGGRVFNVACGNSVTLIEIIKRMRELTGLAGDVKHGPLRAGDVLQSLADISAARKKLGYEPEVSVWDGLEDTVAWFQSKLPN